MGFPSVRQRDFFARLFIYGFPDIAVSHIFLISAAENIINAVGANISISPHAVFFATSPTKLPITAGNPPFFPLVKSEKEINATRLRVAFVLRVSLFKLVFCHVMLR